MRVSIVIPTLNEEECLPKLLASIRAQTLQPHEIIVADAGSKDKTREVAESYGARVVQGGMPGPGRNRGADAATGEILLFLDADVELWDNDFLERSIGEFLERKLDIATCDVYPISPSKLDHVMHKAYNTYVRVRGASFPHVPGFCIFVYRSLHHKICGFDETVTFCEDHDYGKRAAQIGSFGFLKSKAVPVSTRRLQRDGRMTIAVKFALAELHLQFIGPIRHDKFKYTFGHKKGKSAKQGEYADKRERA